MRDFTVAEHARRMAAREAHSTRAIEQDRDALTAFYAQMEDPKAPDVGYQWMYRVGKKAAGRLLDGVQHDGVPVVTDKPVHTNGTHARIGDLNLSFGIARFTTAAGLSDHSVLWRLSIKKHPTSDPVFEVDATPAVLREIARFVERAQEMLATDGGRKERVA